MKRVIYLVVILAVGFLASCEYEFINPDTPTLPPPSPEDTVSYSLQIQPIFDGGCISCHNLGGTPPDLSPDNSYNSITSGGLVNTADPASSTIYDVPQPASSTHTWKKYTETEAAYVLKWIEEGAKNN